MRRQIIVSISLVVLLLASGASLMSYLVRTKPRPPEMEAGNHLLTVRAVKVEPRTTTEPIVGYGTARADRYAWIAAQVAGEVVMLDNDLRSGAEVSTGQVLVSIDPRDYQAALDRARSQVAAAEAALKQIDVEENNLAELVAIAQQEFGVAERELGRVRDLLEQGSSNPREADQARLEFERVRRALRTIENQQALLPQRRVQQEAMCDLYRAEVALAEVNLQRCSIVAPFAGRLDTVNVELGESVGAGTRLLSIVDPVHIEVPIELGVSRRGRVRVGAPARLNLESRADAFWAGQLVRIAPSANELSRTFSLFVEVDNAQQAEPLMPGMFVRACIDGPTLKGVLIVPRGSIQDDRVYVCRDGKAYQRPVHIERQLLNQAVVSGLEPGDVVITSNLDALYDGAPVAVLINEGWAEPRATERPALADAPKTLDPAVRAPVKTP